MKEIFRKKTSWAAATAIALVAAYGLFGFYGVPAIVRSQAVQFVRDEYGRDLTVGEVRFNPFKLQLEIRDVALPDADGQTLLGFKRFFVDFEVASLWNRAFTFKDVILEAPQVRAVVRRGGRVNLADLAPKPQTQPEPEPEPADEGLPAVWIQSFALSDGVALYVDQNRREEFQRRFAPIAFTLKDFRTTPQGGQFGFSAHSQLDEKFEWQGHFALEPGISSEGDFTIAGLRAPGLGDFLGDARPFTLSQGIIDLGGHYRFATQGALQLQVELPKISLTQLSLHAWGADSDWVQIPTLEITNTKIALPEQSVAVGNVTLAGLKAQAWKEADGSINLVQLMHSPHAPGASGVAQPAAPPPAPAAPAAPVKPWSVAVAAFDLREAAIHFQDRSVAPAGDFTVAPLDVGVRDISLDLGKPLPLRFDARINHTASLKGAGQVTPDPLAVDIDLALDGLQLADLRPYLGKVDLTIQSGTVGAQGKVVMTPPDRPEPDLSFAGDVTLANFKSIDNTLKQDFVAFERIELSKLRFAMAPDSVGIDRIRVVKPFSRVFIGQDRVVNVLAVLDPEGTAKSLADSKAAAAQAAQGKSRAAAPAPKAKPRDRARRTAKAAPAPAPELKESGMPIRIRELRIENGTMDFADHGIQPNFAARITSLDGRVTGMSTDPNARAKVDLHGKVGEFSPVTIAGELQPFAFDRYTDVGLKFENISLPIFNPYSGRFAGYNIAQGKLTTDLHYHIEKRQLAAQHHIRVDQLEWGAQTADKAEATLPVKFATWLLKDTDGVINLDVPVNGTLDDPTFRIGPIVWQVIKNVIAKAVTAPFRALGSLFKGAEEAQFVDFAPGSSALDAATTERLAGLARTLAPKKGIRLQVPIGAVAELDAATLADHRYAEQRDAAARKVLLGKKAASDRPTPDFDTLDSDDRIEVLTALVESLTGTRPAIPAPAPAPDGTSRAERKALVAAASLDYLEKEARARLVPEPAELDKLGEARATAIQHALLTDTGLEPERVFLNRSGKAAAQDGTVRFELTMQ